MVQQAFDNLDPGDLLVLITVCSAFLVYFVVLAIARRADNLDVLKVCINNIYKGNSICILRLLSSPQFTHLDDMRVSRTSCNGHRKSLRNDRSPWPLETSMHYMTKIQTF